MGKLKNAGNTNQLCCTLMRLRRGWVQTKQSIFGYLPSSHKHRFWDLYAISINTLSESILSHWKPKSDEGKKEGAFQVPWCQICEIQTCLWTGPTYVFLSTLMIFFTQIENRQRVKHGCAQSLTNQLQLGCMLRCVLGPSAIGQGKSWSGSQWWGGWGAGLRDNLFIQIKSDPGTAECSPLQIWLVVT